MAMLGAECSKCCCNCEQGGELPDFISVTFSNVSVGTFSSGLLLKATVTSDFGSGATVTVSAGGPNTPSPIVQALMGSEGSGYAKYDRISPTLTVTGSGSGATFTPTLTKTTHDGADVWAISSVSVSGGTGYTDGEQLTVTLGEGSYQEPDTESAVLTLHNKISEPTLSASVSGGEDATFSISYSKSGTPPRWAVSGVTVTNGGSGYTDGDAVTFTLGSGDIEVFGASAIINTARTTPTVSLSATQGGSGADLSATLSKITISGLDYWEITGVTIDGAGTGYSLGDYVAATVTDGTEVTSSTITVSNVDGSGGITALSIPAWGRGLFYKDTQQVGSVTVTTEGSYYNDSGEPSSVTVTNGGMYFAPDQDSVELADVEIAITQTAPSDGSGAVIAAIIRSDVNDPFFGQIQYFEVQNGGSGYMDMSIQAGECVQPQILMRESPLFANIAEAVVLGVGPESPGSAIFDFADVNDYEFILSRQSCVPSACILLTGPVQPSLARYVTQRSRLQNEPRVRGACILYSGQMASRFDASRGGDGASVWSEITQLTPRGEDLTDLEIGDIDGAAFVSPFTGHIGVGFRGTTLRPIVIARYAGSFSDDLAANNQGVGGRIFTEVTTCDIVMDANFEDSPYLCDTFSFTASDGNGGTAVVAPAENPFP